MKRLTGYSALLALLLSALVPASALAVKEVVVPPGNAGVNQYTQTVPTAGGNAVVKDQEEKSAAKPKQVLGDKGAAELEAKGAEGKAAAELAAEGAQPVETAPETAPVEEEAAEGHHKGGAAGHDGGKGGGHGKGQNAGGGKSQANGGGDKAGGGKGAGEPAQVTVEAQAPLSDGSSSGIGKIVDQVTGSGSSGELGLWMPIALLVGLAWCVVYTWRRRGHTS
jgi:hypothetical protein